MSALIKLNLIQLFLTFQLCGIIGGTFTVAGIIDSLVFSATQIYEKAALDKLGWTLRFSRKMNLFWLGSVARIRKFWDSAVTAVMCLTYWFLFDRHSFSMINSFYLFLIPRNLSPFRISSCVFLSVKLSSFLFLFHLSCMVKFHFDWIIPSGVSFLWCSLIIHILHKSAFLNHVPSFKELVWLFILVQYFE